MPGEEQSARLMVGKDRPKKALNSLDFLVVQEIFMSETAKFANVVLPGASFFEKSGTIHQWRAPRAARERSHPAAPVLDPN